MIKEDMGLTDIWRLTDHMRRNIPFFKSLSQISSRTDLFLIADSLIKSVVICDIRTVAITDHAAVESCLKVELETGGGPDGE